MIKKISEVQSPIDPYLCQVLNHYESCWGKIAKIYRLDSGPQEQLSKGFCVLEFRPSVTRSMWTYATCGMSNQGDADAVEIHLFSPSSEPLHVELLTAIAHFHLTGAYVNLGHTVNFGRPWFCESVCDYGLLSLPYLDGPKLEWAEINGRKVRFLWLIPITPDEVLFKKKNGLEDLETAFENHSFNYLDIKRKSVVG